MKDDYPWNSPYAFAENDVISHIDLEGAEKFKATIQDHPGGKRVIITLTSLDVSEGLLIDWGEGMGYTKDLKFYHMKELFEDHYEFFPADKTIKRGFRVYKQNDRSQFEDYYQEAGRSWGQTYKGSDGKNYPLPTYQSHIDLSIDQAKIPHFITEKKEFIAGGFIGGKGSSETVEDFAKMDLLRKTTNGVVAYFNGTINNQEGVDFDQVKATSIDIRAFYQEDLDILVNAAKSQGFTDIRSRIDTTNLKEGAVRVSGVGSYSQTKENTDKKTVD
jgi:hypothetical protein